MSESVAPFAENFHKPENCRSETTPQPKGPDPLDIGADPEGFARHLDAYLCERLCINQADYYSHRRDHFLCRPRHLAIFLLVNNGIGYAPSARLYKRTHRTAMASCERFISLYLHDAEYRKLYADAVSFMRGLGWRFKCEVEA